MPSLPSWLVAAVATQIDCASPSCHHGLRRVAEVSDGIQMQLFRAVIRCRLRTEHSMSIAACQRTPSHPRNVPKNGKNQPV